MSVFTLSENPHEDLVNNIEHYGWKLGVLEMIRNLYRDNPTEFDAIGIKVWPEFMPTIIPSWSTLTEEVFQGFLQRYGITEWSEILVRGSVPGDFCSLVDIIPTDSLRIPYTEYRKKVTDGYEIIWTPEWATEIITPCQQINDVLWRIKNRVMILERDIQRYAKLSGVHFSIDDISFGLVPRFSEDHITVTEHPNLNEVYIEEHFSKKII